jgi:hypothetical protein
MAVGFDPPLYWVPLNSTRRFATCGGNARGDVVSCCDAAQAAHTRTIISLCASFESITYFNDGYDLNGFRQGQAVFYIFLRWATLVLFSATSEKHFHISWFSKGFGRLAAFICSFFLCWARTLFGRKFYFQFLAVYGFGLWVLGTTWTRTGWARAGWVCFALSLARRDLFG